MGRRRTSNAGLIRMAMRLDRSHPARSGDDEWYAFCFPVPELKEEEEEDEQVNLKCLYQDLMEIKLNGPDLKNEELICVLATEAFELWVSRKQRNPNKAHFVARPRKNKFVSRPVLDLLADGYNDDPSVSASTEGETTTTEPATAEEAEEDAQSRIAANAAVFASATALSIPPGWAMLSEPLQLGQSLIHV